MIPPAKSNATTATAALTIVQNNIFMLLSSDVTAVYRHRPHMMKADKAIKIYKMNFMVFPPLWVLQFAVELITYILTVYCGQRYHNIPVEPTSSKPR